jgi:hypothetical protein
MRSFVAVLCVALARPVRAQTSPAAPHPPFTTRGAFFALSVANVGTSARWYAEKFGLTVVMRAPKTNGASATVLEGGGLIVELVQRDDAMPLSAAAPSLEANYRVHGLFKAGMIVDDFDKTLRDLGARGVEVAIGPFAATAEQRANVIVRDNAGNLIQIFDAKR